MHLLIIGAGGHSKVVADSARSMGIEQISFLDEGAGARLEDLSADIHHFIVAIGDNVLRQERFEYYQSLGLTPFTVIHESACIASSVTLGAGSFVSARAVINADAHIGHNVVVNTAAVIEHDCQLGDHSFVAPSASLCGGVRIDTRAFVGTNATMLPLSSLGADAVLGAGSVLKQSIEDRAVAVGAPARVIKKK